MGYYSPDPYYQPEAFGLTKLIEEDDPNASYSFDLFVIWKHEDGRVFYATDSGCSCPSPFEWARGLEDLEELTDWEEFENEVTIWSDYLEYPEGKHNLLRAAAEALHESGS